MNNYVRDFAKHKHTQEHLHTQTHTHTHEFAPAFPFFTVFCSYLRDIISLSNPFPYIKWCSLLHLASSTHCTSCWQHHCFPQKAPSQSRQGDGKERETDPSSISWKISSFFVSPLKKTGIFFSFCLGTVIEQNKQVLPASLPLELSYFEQRIRWGSFVQLGGGVVGMLTVEELWALHLHKKRKKKTTKKGFNY